MTSDDGSGEPEIGSVRYNERGEVEFYDGTQWGPYGGDVGGATRIDWDEWSLIRETRFDRDGWGPSRDDGADGQEPG
ncbi:hypothetical protein [Streptomyces sp. enrichment culture]|uniref:hypothetical protein n=1 Tax=Streptomyces sp. enrichment culture TaxID=1795815 RepID=UPI003F57EC59